MKEADELLMVEFRWISVLCTPALEVTGAPRWHFTSTYQYFTLPRPVFLHFNSVLATFDPCPSVHCFRLVRFVLPVTSGPYFPFIYVPFLPVQYPYNLWRPINEAEHGSGDEISGPCSALVPQNRIFHWKLQPQNHGPHKKLKLNKIWKMHLA